MQTKLNTTTQKSENYKLPSRNLTLGIALFVCKSCLKLQEINRMRHITPLPRNNFLSVIN